MENELKVFAGSSHKKFAEQICQYLDIPLGESETIRFSNENLMPKIGENVRGCDVFVIQTQMPPVSDHIIELLAMIRALRDASASRITAVLPYFFCARGDKKDQPRIPIMAKFMADLIQTAGTNRVLTMDFHSAQIQGFFDIPVDQLSAKPILCHYLKQQDLTNSVAVAADVGESKGVGGFANILNLPIAIVDKRREGNEEKAKPVNLIGEVRGKRAIIFDDEIATAETLVEAAKFSIEKHGATEAWAAVTHPVLSGKAIPRLKEADYITKVIATDTIPLPPEKRLKKIEQLTATHLFAEAIRRIHKECSVTELLDFGKYREIFRL